MAKYLAEVVRDVQATWESLCADQAGHPGASYQWALPDVRLSTRLAGRAREKAGGAGRHCSSFITLRLVCHAA